MQNVITEEGLKYEPPPPISPEFQAEFDRIVPISPNNLDRFLKFSWGMDRMEFYCGVFSPRYGDLSDPPKYIGREGWVLEGWQSPDVYDRDAWKQCEDILGPWPENGVWDFLAYHETTTGEFLPLDNTALDLVRSWKFWKGCPVTQSLDMLMAFRSKRFQNQQERGRAVAKEFGTEFVRTLEKVPDSRPAFSIPAPLKGFVHTDSGILVKNI